MIGPWRFWTPRGCKVWSENSFNSQVLAHYNPLLPLGTGLLGLGPLQRRLAGRGVRCAMSPKLQPGTSQLQQSLDVNGFLLLVDEPCPRIGEPG